MKGKTKEDIQIFPSGATSSRQPRFELIPYLGLVRIADRFEHGLEKHKDRSWNALAKNQSPLEDRDFYLERANHVANHALKLLAIVKGEIPDDGDDHEAAIAWGGIYLCVARVRKSVA